MTNITRIPGKKGEPIKGIRCHFFVGTTSMPSRDFVPETLVRPSSTVGKVATPSSFFRHEFPDEDSSRARRVSISTRLDEVASLRGWTWPAMSTTLAFTGVTLLAVVHRMIDLGTYLLGGSYAFHGNLYETTYLPTHLGFTYPPFAAILFWPMSHLPAEVDQIVFSWMSLAALLGIVVISFRVTSASLRRRSVTWWSLTLLTPIVLLDPVRESFLLGQINILLALAVIADVTVIQPDRRGWLVGLAAAIKITPLILIPYFFLTHQRGTCKRAIASFIAAGVVTTVLTPTSSWRYWTRALWKPKGAGWLPWVGNQGIVGVVDRGLARSIATPTMFILVVLVVAVGLFIAVQADQKSSYVLGFLAVEATESLASPVSWSHHFVWVVLLIAWLALAPERPAHGESWAGLVAVIFWAAPIWWVHHGPTVRFAAHGWLAIPGDAFFIVFALFLAGISLRLVRTSRRSRVTT